MTAQLLTATLPVNVYEDAGRSTAQRVHVSRALGGPVAILLIGFIALILVGTFGGPLSWSFAILSFSAMDGGVIWRKITKVDRMDAKALWLGHLMVLGLHGVQRWHFAVAG